MTVDFNYPYSISADTPAVAAEVQQNFAQLLSWIKTNYRQTDDTPNLTVVPVMPGLPTVPSHAANKAYVDAIIPTGTIFAWAGTALPTVGTYLWCDGGSHSTTGAYAGLFDVIGYSYGGAGGSFNVPNLQGRFPLGRGGSYPTLNAPAGSANAIVVDHGHGHTIAVVAGGGTHEHTSVSLSVSGTAADAGAHTHNFGAGFGFLYNDPGLPGGWTISGTGTINLTGGYQHAPNHSHAVSGTATGTIGSTSSGHNHTISGGITANGSSGTGANMPPYVVVNYIIRA
jgi:microcystin-dependent protein